MLLEIIISHLDSSLYCFGRVLNYIINCNNIICFILILERIPEKISKSFSFIPRVK